MPVGNRKQVTAIVRDLERFTERLIVKITLDVTANLIETLRSIPAGRGRIGCHPWVSRVGAQRNCSREGPHQHLFRPLPPSSR